jgi:predicted RNA-binding Zn ribbon-like protein
MSKLQQAPGELEHVRAFVNTVDIEQRTDELESPQALATWLAARGLIAPGVPASAADLTHAIELREALRAVLLAHTGASQPPGGAAAALDAAASRAAVQLRFDDPCVGSLVPAAAGVDAALGRLLVIVYSAIANRTWQRLKACREHTCEWAFYDHTKNRAGAWCNMAVCGNRAKARAYRDRHAASGSARANPAAGKLQERARMVD